MYYALNKEVIRLYKCSKMAKILFNRKNYEHWSFIKVER